MRLARGLVFSSWLRVVLVAAPSAGVVFAAPAAQAQSAADKATARTLATDGIKAFQAGRFAEALDKLQRAQSLYEAPIHLLYIARSQVKLDKLVEGAETYRKLARVQLDAGAAPTQKQAVESATLELAELEPKIPTLRLEVEPANVSSLEIRIDGERVPPAIVGVDRSANPGSHKVQVWAPGFNPAEANIELRASEKKAVPLRLEPGSNAAPPAGFVAPGQTPPSSMGSEAQPVTAPPSEQKAAVSAKPSAIGFIVGLRAGAAIPTGDLGVVTDFGDSSRPISDFAQVGGGLELRAGVRFAKYFTGLLYFGRYVLKPGPFWDELVDGLPNDVHADNKAFAQEAGFGVMVAAAPGKFGPFGELDFAFHRRFEVQQTVTAENADCEVTWKLSSAGARLVGGVQIPIGKLFHLSPYLGVSGGKSPDKWSPEWSGDRDCRVIDELPIEDGKSNGLFVIGIGGDFLFGKDRAE